MLTLDVQARPEAVAVARRFVREHLLGWGQEVLLPDAELVLTELLGNVVLHAPGMAQVRLQLEDDGLRIEIEDSSPILPARRLSVPGSTTGRGLNLVAALCADWGVRAREDGQVGKVVWCVLPREGVERPAPQVDEASLLAEYIDEMDGYEVHAGDAPVGLLLEAKDQLDGVLREISLAQRSQDLPHDLMEPMAAAVRAFADARQQLRRMLTTAAAAGQSRVQLVFHLPLELAERGEEYLRALGAADAFARDRRMLSLESPVEHRVLREWYVGNIVRALRAAAAGEPAAPPENFEDRLLHELRALEQERRTAERGARLQRVTARLAGSETVQDIATIALQEATDALGSAGGSLTRRQAGVTAPVVEVGVDVGLGARYLALPLPSRPQGPSTSVLAGGVPVWVEGRQEPDARFPQAASLQPDVVAWAVLPLATSEGVIGALRLSWTAPHVFSRNERAFLEALAVQTSQALARVDALGRLRGLRDELDRLLRSGGGISQIDLGVLRTLYEDAPIGFMVYDAQGRYLRVNEAVARLTGRRVEDYVGRTIAEMVPPGGAPQQVADLHALLHRVLAGERSVEQEVASGGPGPRRWWQTSWFPVRDAEGRVEAAVVLALDITPQRRAEARARLLSELGDRLGQDRSEAAVLRAAASAVVPELAEWLVVHLLDERGTIWAPLVHHGDPELARALRALFQRKAVTLDQPHGAGRVLATGVTQELPVVDEALLALMGGDDAEFTTMMRRVGMRNGVVVPLRAGGRVLGTLSVGRSGEPMTPDDLTILEDIGRRAAVAIESTRALSTAVRLELALDAADIGSYDWHVRTGHFEWDDRLAVLLDLDRTVFDGSMQTFFSRIHPDDLARVSQAIEHAVLTTGDLTVGYQIVRADGTNRWIEARARALAGVDGRTERIVGTAIDVTARREGDARAHRTLELMGDAFFSTDHELRFTYVNRQAERVLGRTRDQLLGQDMFDVFPDARGGPFEAEYRAALATGSSRSFEQFFRPLGRHFEVRVHPGPEGLSVYFADVSDRRATQEQRDRALARLGLLNDIGAALTATLDVDQALILLADLLVPLLADLVSIDLRDSDDVRGSRAIVVTASDAAKAAALQEADEVLPRRHNPSSAVHQVLMGAPLVHLQVTPEHLGTVARDDGQLRHYLLIDMRYALVVPLLARDRVFGVISLLRTGPGAADFTPDDILIAQEIGRRAGLMVDNVAQYTAQRSVAEGLQRSLLPELPEVPGVVLGAAYEPSSSAAKVGGDWYDAFVLPDGALGLVIGDVMGHDIAAAAAMGQLRSVLRTCASDGDRPALVLDRLDRLVSSFAMADLATVIYARLDRRTDGSALLTWANAGHPPPLLLLPDGTSTFLREGGSIMIGAPSDEARDEGSRVLPAGATLLMFTDGLVERRGSDLDDQLAGLSRTAVELWPQVGGPGELCRRLIATVRRDADTDDAAAVALTLLGPALAP